MTTLQQKGEPRNGVERKEERLAMECCGDEVDNSKHADLIITSISRCRY